ncbi:hypothetical protein BV20DRAFT_1083728 [Pilatotrama ljubarskyi]|nr:hypothetical protein BV20DRAFT_1083728 [Pilatotrama ljubarskyi]
MAPSPASFPKLSNRNYQQWRLGMEARLRTLGALRADRTLPSLWTAENGENCATTTAGWTLPPEKSGTASRGSNRHTWRRSETILAQCGGSWSLCTCRNVLVRVLTPTTPSSRSPRRTTSP